ncbi:MAG: ATP-binding cassette domain-containing protein [bacterium]
MLEFREITKEYGSLTALDKVSFKIAKGEFVFLVGPSGAGKSTLVKLLIRKELPSEGEVLYEDIPICQLKEKYLPLLRQEIGVVFQDFKLLNTKTVFENVAFGLEVMGFEESAVLERVEEALKLTRLWEIRDHFPVQLSGGEAQRAAIARSVALAPKVLVADEPTGNVDPALTDSLFEIFEKINKKGITVIVATHDKDEVDKMKKRVVELDKGRVVRDEKKGKYAKS